MHIPILILEWFVFIADAIILAVITFFGVIIVLIAFAISDGDDYWTEGGMPQPEKTKTELTR